MRTTSFAKVAALCGLLALSGCASKITQPDKYSEPPRVSWRVFYL